MSDFGNFAIFELEQKPSIRCLLQLHQKQQHFDVEAAIEIIMAHRAMIDDYFSIIITDDLFLTGLPVILKNYIPNFRKLPKFLYDLACNVDWSDEMVCFKSYGECVSQFYSLSNAHLDDKLDEKMRDNLFPFIRKKLKPSSLMAGCIFKVTDVPTLYKVFHRC